MRNINDKTMINNFVQLLGNMAFFVFSVIMVKPLGKLISWMATDTIPNGLLLESVDSHLEVFSHIFQIGVAIIALIYGYFQICKIRGELKDRKARKLKESGNYKEID